MSAEARIRGLGLVLPALTPPSATFLRHKQVGDLLFLSGQGARDEKGALLVGRVGDEISLDEARRRARLIGLGLLAAAREAVGSLDRIDGVVRVLGMVNAAPDFMEHPKVIDGCSNLFVEVFGEAGRHARSAVGMGTLPSRISVEIEAIFSLKPRI
jgi:enamine deaminase RidA (YjgF/YER057c/UK114 family)